MTTWNETIFYTLYEFASETPLARDMIGFIGQFGDVILLALIGVFVVFHHHNVGLVLRKNMINNGSFEYHRIDFFIRVKEFFAACVVGLSAWFVTLGTKKILGAPRPFEILPDVVPLFEYVYNESFPSGHATFFSALALSLLWDHRMSSRRLWLVSVGAFLGALVIGFSRVASGVHFPIDILAGLVFGVGIATALRICARWIVRLYNKKQRSHTGAGFVYWLLNSGK